MSHSSPNRTDRKSELLIIARRSRIRWVRSAGEAGSDAAPRKFKIAVKINEKPIGGKRNESSLETIQRTFHFLTDIIADGETVDVESLISKIDIHEYDDNYDNHDEARDDGDKEHSSSSSMSLEDYSYGVFLDTLCSRGAVGAVKSMQQFVSKFETKQRTRTTGQRTGSRYTDERANYLESVRGAEGIWLFLEHISRELQLSCMPLLSASSEQEALIKTYCERFIFFKLHASLFHSAFEDYFLNEKLFERIRSLSFLRPEHLDIKLLDSDSRGGPGSDSTMCPGAAGSRWWLTVIEGAMTSLLQLQHATCPEDKVLCLRAMSREIAAAVQRKGNGTCSTDSTDISFPGADDMLPMLILCVKESNPCNLHSELKYLQLYLNPAHTHGEAGYLLTQLASAVNFLETVDAAALTISKEEFNRSLRRCTERRETAFRYDSDGAGDEEKESIVQGNTATGSRLTAVGAVGGVTGPLPPSRTDESHPSRAFQSRVQDPPHGTPHGEGEEEEPSLFETYAKRTLRQ